MSIPIDNTPPHQRCIWTILRAKYNYKQSSITHVVAKRATRIYSKRVRELTTPRVVIKSSRDSDDCNTHTHAHTDAVYADLVKSVYGMQGCRIYIVHHSTWESRRANPNGCARGVCTQRTFYIALYACVYNQTREICFCHSRTYCTQECLCAAGMQRTVRPVGPNVWNVCCCCLSAFYTVRRRVHYNIVIYVDHIYVCIYIQQRSQESTHSRLWQTDHMTCWRARVQINIIYINICIYQRRKAQRAGRNSREKHVMKTRTEYDILEMVE